MSPASSCRSSSSRSSTGSCSRPPAWRRRSSPAGWNPSRPRAPSNGRAASCSPPSTTRIGHRPRRPPTTHGRSRELRPARDPRAADRVGRHLSPFPMTFPHFNRPPRGQCTDHTRRRPAVRVHVGLIRRESVAGRDRCLAFVGHFGKEGYEYHRVEDNCFEDLNAREGR